MTNEQYQQLEQLATMARPVSDADDGSITQTERENAFSDAVEQVLPEHLNQRLSNYWLKATSEEGIDCAIRLVRAIHFCENPDDVLGQSWDGPHAPDGQKHYEFTFVFVGDGSNEQEALADALDSIRTHLDSGSLEPWRVTEVK